ncbi:MAG TPA: DDE-type integrase/transposase/recombinase [Burkholderiaceae bacterium]|nr:DDE-type integrase/transposase/recombinase [Burkholderiaceae bacterium]
MNSLHALSIVLQLQPSSLACCCLLWWLWRHRRVQAPLYRGRCKVGCAARKASHPKAKPQWVHQKVLYLCAHMSSCRAVAHAFNRWQGCWATVGKTWVWEFMREHKAEIRALRRQRKRRKPYFIAVGHAWALDLTFVRSPHCATFTVLAILDAGSRKLLRLEVLPTKCALVVLGHLLIAFGSFGLPAVLRTDNEAMFRSRLWLAMLKALGVLHRRGPPRQPWRNGRIERVIGTLKATLRGLRSKRGLKALLTPADA